MRDIVYQSFLIFDNPNQHDPGELDQESMQKMSQINIDFYKTFINPNPVISEQHFISDTSRNKVLGFESKMVRRWSKIIIKYFVMIIYVSFYRFNVMSL